MADEDERASPNPERKQQRQELKAEAKRLAKDAGLDWETLSKEQRKELKRGLREQMRRKET